MAEGKGHSSLSKMFFGGEGSKVCRRHVLVLVPLIGVFWLFSGTSQLVSMALYPDQSHSDDLEAHVIMCGFSALLARCEQFEQVESPLA